MAHLIHTLAKVGFTELPVDEFKSIYELFHKTFRKQYPTFKSEDRNSFEFKISENEIKPKHKRIRSYTLTSLDKCWGVIVTSTDIAFHTKNYISIDDFWQRLEALLRFIHEQLEIDYLDYVGIRYFNQLKSIGPTDLVNLVKRPDVLQPILYSQPDMCGSMMQSKYKNDDGVIQLCSGIVINEPALPRAMLPLAQQLESTIDSGGINIVIDIDSFYSPETPEDFGLEVVRDKIYSLRNQAKAVYSEIVEDLEELS